MIADAAFPPALREDYEIALAAVSYDGCALKHVAPPLRRMAEMMENECWFQQKALFLFISSLAFGMLTR